MAGPARVATDRIGSSPALQPRTPDRRRGRQHRDVRRRAAHDAADSGGSSCRPAAVPTGRYRHSVPSVSGASPAGRLQRADVDGHVVNGIDPALAVDPDLFCRHAVTIAPLRCIHQPKMPTKRPRPARVRSRRRPDATPCLRIPLARRAHLHAVSLLRRHRTGPAPTHTRLRRFSNWHLERCSCPRCRRASSSKRTRRSSAQDLTWSARSSRSGTSNRRAPSCRYSSSRRSSCTSTIPRMSRH